MIKSLTRLFLPALLMFAIAAPVRAADPATVIDLPVSGMTCPFCVHGVKKQLEKLPGVAKAQVSLEKKLARITMQPGKTADMAAIRKAITEAGFTPGEPDGGAK